MRLLATCVLIIAINPVYSSAQRASVQQRNPECDLWLVRSQTITEDLIKDAADLTSTDRVLLWARLAQHWWRANPEKARLWLQKAIDIVKDVPNKENSTERHQRLGAARSLLQIITPLDQELSKQLVSFLTEDAERSADAERAANANGLVEAALSLVNKDPQRAVQLGVLALRVGRPSNIGSLLIALRQKVGKMADALFTEALLIGRQTLASELLNSLAYAAFPAERQIGPNTPVPSDDLRRELLELDLSYLQANPINAENKNSICASIGAFIAPILVQFDRLVPQQAVLVRQSVIQCNSSSPLVRQRMDDALNDQPLNTVEALLKAADNAQDSKTRTVYQYRAATLAKEKKDLDLAVKILDSIDKEGRKFMGGSWEAYRWGWAALSAINHFKNEDIYGMHLVINAVPADLQPFAKLSFVGHLPEKRNMETDPTLEFLTEARIGLGRSGVSDAEKCTWYFGLLELTVKYQPADATAVLKEAVAALNRAAHAKDDGDKDTRSGLLESISKNLPATLLEMDEPAVKEAISAISASDTRARVRLDLLGACLARLSKIETSHS